MRENTQSEMTVGTLLGLKPLLELEVDRENFREARYRSGTPREGAEGSYCRVYVGRPQGVALGLGRHGGLPAITCAIRTKNS